MVVCPYCGTQNVDSAKYCNSCGLEINPDLDLVDTISKNAVFQSSADAITLNLEGFDDLVNSERATHDLAAQDADRTAQLKTHDLRYPDDGPYIPDEPFRQAQARDSYYSGPAYPAHAESPAHGISEQPTAEFSSAPKGLVDNSLQATPNTYSSTSYVAVDGAKKPGRKKAKLPLVVAIIVAAVLAIALFVTYSLELWGGKAVPDVIGKTESEAVAILEQDGFTTQVAECVDDGPEGVVIGTDPAGSSRIPEGSLVTVNISVPRTIPDVIGKTQEEALELLRQSGYTQEVSIVEEKSNEASGNVVAIAPTVGEVAVASCPITLSVAIPFTVPSVEGLTRQEAVDALEAEGYVVSISQYNTNEIAEGMAVSTDPASGTELASGSQVVLYVAHDRAAELVELTRQFFAGSNNYIINGTSYELSEVKSVSYSGDGVCAYSIVARPYETHSWFGTQTETRYGNYETINGTLTWDSDNDLVKTDPSLRRA